MGKVIIPAVSGAIGLVAKFILNLVLVPNPNFGANGAAIASVVNIILAFAISYIVLIKNMKLNMKFSKYVFKPCLATTIMCICSYFIYNNISNAFPGKISIIISLLISFVIYIVSVVLLKVFNKEEIHMLPGGAKMYNIFQKIGIYK